MEAKDYWLLAFGGIAAASGLVNCYVTVRKHRREERDNRRTDRWSLDLRPHPVKWWAYDARLRYRARPDDAFRIRALTALYPENATLAPAENGGVTFPAGIGVTKIAWSDVSAPTVYPSEGSGSAKGLDFTIIVRLASAPGITPETPIKIIILLSIEDISADKRMSQMVVQSQATAWTARKPARTI